MSEELKSAQEIVKEKLEAKDEVKVKTDEEFLMQAKKDHQELSQKIIQNIQDMEIIKNDKSKVDLFSMMTMKIQTMNLYSYFLAIIIKMLEVQKLSKEIKEKQMKEESKGGK